MSNQKYSLNESSHQYTEAPSAIEKNQDQLEYLSKISNKLGKLRTYHVQLIDEYNCRLQEILFELETELSQKGMKYKAQLLRGLASIYSEILAFQKQFLINKAISNTTPVKQTKLPYLETTATERLSYVGKLGGTHVGSAEYIQSYSQSKEKYQDKLARNLRWHDSESQQKYKDRLVRSNEKYANIDLSQCLIKPIKYEGQVKIMSHKNIATDDIETKLKELLMMQEYDLKHFQVQDELTKEKLSLKKEEIKKMKQSGTYDELMRMIKWLNQKNGSNEQWIAAEIKYEMPTIDMDRLDTEQFEQHLQQNYSFIQKNALQTIIQYFKRKKTQVVKPVKVPNTELMKLEKKNQDLKDRTDKEKRLLNDKIANIKKKLNIYIIQLAQKDKEVDSLQNLSQMCQQKLLKLLKETTKLFDEFQQSMNIKSRRQQSSNKKKKQSKGGQKDQNDSLTNLFNLDLEEGLGKLKEKIEEQNVDNQKLIQQVKELNSQIEQQEIDFTKKIKEIQRSVSNPQPQRKERKKQSVSYSNSRALSAQNNQQMKQNYSKELIEIQIKSEENQNNGLKSINICTNEPNQVYELQKPGTQDACIEANIAIQLVDQESQVMQTRGTVNLKYSLFNQQHEKERQIYENLKRKNEKLKQNNRSIEDKIRNYNLIYDSSIMDRRYDDKAIQTDSILMINKLEELINKGQIKMEQEDLQQFINQQRDHKINPNDHFKISFYDNKPEQQLNSTKKEEDQQEIVNMNKTAQPQNRQQTESEIIYPKSQQETKAVQQDDNFFQIKQIDNNQLQDVSPDKNKKINQNGGTSQDEKVFQYELTKGKIAKIRSLTQHYIQMQNTRDQQVFIQQPSARLNQRLSELPKIDDMKEYTKPMTKKQMKNELLKGALSTRQVKQVDTDLEQSNYLKRVQLRSVDLAKREENQEDENRNKTENQKHRSISPAKYLGNSQIASVQPGDRIHQGIDQKEKIWKMKSHSQDAIKLDNPLMSVQFKKKFDELNDLIITQLVNNKIIPDQNIQMLLTSKDQYKIDKEKQQKLYTEQENSESVMGNKVRKRLQIHFKDKSTFTKTQDDLMSSPIMKRVFKQINESKDGIDQQIKSILRKNGDEWNYKKFREIMKILVKGHKYCGENCIHLKRFYERYGVILNDQYKNRIELKLNKSRPNPFDD